MTRIAAVANDGEFDEFDLNTFVVTVRGFPQMSTADILPEWHLLPEM